jgi:hypothetical protein
MKKIIRNRSSTAPTHCVVIRPATTDCPNPLKSRDELATRLYSIKKEGPLATNGIDIAASVLVDPNCQLLAKFYSRDEGVDGWYYEVYGTVCDNQTHNDEESMHFLSEIFRFPAFVKPGTSVALLKNGPTGGAWETNADEIEIRDVLTSLWFYFRSGKDPKCVFAERELRRFLQSKI